MGQLEDILKHQNMVRNNIMKSFGAETSEDSLEKSFEDEVNPFEMEAYKSELTKAELDEFEKAKHQDGDMHPNGKWVWRQSANGGKGNWRVAKPGGSKATTGGGAAATKTTAGDSKVAKFMDALKTVNSKYTDESKVSVMKTPKGNWEVSYDGHVVGTVTSGILSEKVAKDKGWIKDDNNDKIINSQSASAAKAYVKFLDGKNESMSFNDHFAEAIERANGDTNKVLKVFKEHLKKHLMSAGVAPESVDGYYKQFQSDLDTSAIKNYLKKKGIEWNWTKKGDKKKPEKSSFESKEADAYDKGDGKVGNYPVPTHTSYPASNLYSRLKNNRHFGFKYGLPEEEIMKKLKDYKGNVKVSYHNNAGTSEIYRIKFL